MTGQYIYMSNPYPFAISVITAGYYAGGNYYQIEAADQFVSKDTLEIYRKLIFKDWEETQQILLELLLELQTNPASVIVVGKRYKGVQGSTHNRFGIAGM
jgi:hypothetical protein